MSIDKIRNIGLDKLVTQVYDFDSLTTDELMCKFAQKINIIIEHFNYLDKQCQNNNESMKLKLEYLLNQGLEEQVARSLMELINNGTLGNLINQSLLTDIYDKVGDIQDEVNDQLKQTAKQDDLVVLRNRVDGLSKLEEGSTTGDAELIDGRIGGDGITYETLGQSIRTQVDRLNKGLFTDVQYNKLNLTFVEGYYNLKGEIVNGAANFRAEINVEVGETYKIQGASFWQMPMYVFLDVSRVFKFSVPSTATSEEYEKEINITEPGILVINYTTSRNGSGEEYKPKCYKKIYNSKFNEVNNEITTVKNSVESNTKAINNNSSMINDVKDLLTDNNYKEINMTFENGAININGNILNDSAYYHYDVKINTLIKYKVTGYNFWQMPLYAILDKDGKILECYPKSSQESFYIEKEITSFPVGAVTLRVNYSTNVSGTGNEYKSKCYKTNGLLEQNNPLANLGKTNVLTSIFDKYGIIGDSLSSGAQDTENGSNAVDMPKFSWATFLEKATGCETVRLSKGGLQLKNWHTIMEAKARLEENKCPAYIIMIGHNDTTSPAGSISDVDLANLSNSSDTTQFGMYGRLIGTLRDISPNCRIFCVTYPIYYVENYGTNDIARTLPKHIDNCYCVDLWANDENRKTETNTSFAVPNPYFSKLHGTVLGYKHWADIINSCIDYIIRQNLSDFADIGYINTDYSFE